MWWRTRSTTRSRSSRRQRSRSRNAPASSAPDDVVAQEPPVGHRRRLADVVDERGQTQVRGLGRGGIHGPQRVVPQVLARDLVLGHPTLRGELRRDVVEQAQVGQQPQRHRRPRAAEHLRRARPRCARRTGGRPARARAWMPASVAGSMPKSSVAARRTTRSMRSASSSKRRRGSPTARRVRDARSASPSCGSTSDRRLARPAAPGDGVDGHVAAGQVELDRVGELDVMRPPEVGVVVVGAEGRDLDLADGRVAGPDGDRPERVLVDGVVEQRLGLLGPGGRGQVPVPRRHAQQRVAQRAADDPGGVAGRLERGQDVQDRRRDRGGHVRGSIGRGRRRRTAGLGQFFPRNRYDRHASLRSSSRYGVNSE